MTKKNIISSLALLLFLSVGLTSCASSYYPGSFTVASTDSQISVPSGGEMVEGESCNKGYFFNLVMFNDGGQNAAMAMAIQNGLDKGLKGNALVDVEVETYVVPAVLYNSICYTVRGRLVTL